MSGGFVEAAMPSAVVFVFDIEIFQRYCYGERRRNQEDQFEKDRERIENEHASVSGKIHVAQSKQK